MITVWEIFVSKHLKVHCHICQVEHSLKDKRSVTSVIAFVLHNVIKELHAKIRMMCNESTNFTSYIYFLSFTAQIHFWM